MVKRRVVRLVGAGAAALTLAQLVPYGWRHDNPPVIAEAPWPSAATRSIARSSCYDCHSNETKWPPQSYVAPSSWLIRRDVDRGRSELNFSEWSDRSGADDAAEAVAEGSMPPQRYTLMHPSARLTAREKAALVAALRQMEQERDGSRGRGRGR